MKQTARNRSALFLCLLLLPTLAPSPPAGADSYERLGRSVLQALRERSFARLKALTPGTPAICRKLAPKEFGGKSDREIARSLKKTYYPKLRRDFDNVLRSARDRKIDLSKLTFIGVHAHPLEDSSIVAGVEIDYAYKELNGTLTVAAAELDGTYYLTEFLISYDPFARLVEK
jgi:hypothetical protein